MAMNRVQFQPGLSIHAFMALYGTQEKCEAAVIQWRWPEKYVCPSCGHIDPSFSSFRRGDLLYRQYRAPITPSNSPSTPIATSRRSSTGSIVASTCEPSFLAWLALLVAPNRRIDSEFELLKLVANQYSA